MDAESVVLGLLDTGHYVFDPLPIAVDIELEDLGVAASGCGLLQGGLGDRTDHMHSAELGGSLGCVGTCAGGEDLQGADGGQHDGDAQVVAEEGGGGVDLGDVHQHPGAEGYAVEGEPVASHGSLGLGAAYQVVPRALNKVLAGSLHYLFVADKVGGHVESPRPGCQGWQ